MKRLILGLLTMSLAAAAMAQSTQPAERPEVLIARFAKGGSREQFLKELRAAVAAKQDKWYEKEFASLIEALEQETPPPGGYEKPPTQRLPAEKIDAAIYDLRDGSRWMGPRNPTGTDPIETLKAAGPAAMDALVAALDDDSVTREIGMEAGISNSILLRRCDKALECIESISGIRFFNRTQGRGGHFHNDGQRDSAAANVRAWWKLARGKGQAEGFRIQLQLWTDNTTLNRTGEWARYNASYEAGLLFGVADVEGLDAVIERLRALYDSHPPELNSYLTEGLLRLDPQYVLQHTLARLDENRPADGDYFILLKYGDKKVYQKLCARAVEHDEFDPGPWNIGEQTTRAAEYGKNWAIPFVAAALGHRKMIGSRGWGSVSQNFCEADVAIEPFQTLTGKDFGYRKEASEADRLAAIDRAAKWWDADGRVRLADAIAADHPCLTDGTDLLASEQAIDDITARLASPDATAARAAVASLGKVYAYRTQQALLKRLAKEPDAAQRVAILGKLERPSFWTAPALANVLEKDASTPVRAAAAGVLLVVLDPATTGYHGQRLESKTAALDAVRVVAAADPPDELAIPLSHVLIRNQAESDRPLIETLACRASVAADPEVKAFLSRQPTKPLH